MPAAERAKPGRLSHASPGNGASPHLATELLKSPAKVSIDRTACRGSGTAVGDVVAGHVPMMFDAMRVVGPHIKSDKLHPIAAAAANRLEGLLNVPTAAEAGAMSLDMSSWQAVFAPAKTPKPIVQRLNEGLVRAVDQPEVKGRLEDMAVAADGVPSEELAERRNAEIARWEEVVNAQGVKPD